MKKLLFIAFLSVMSICVRGYSEGGVKAENAIITEAVAENVVRDAYLSVFEREADEEGLRHHVSLLINGKINSECLVESLKNTEEYRLKEKMERQRAVSLAKNLVIALFIVAVLTLLSKLPRLKREERLTIDSHSHSWISESECLVPICIFFRRYQLLVFIGIFLVLLIVPRIQNIAADFVDDPHAWRQSDTACYAYTFYKEGIDILKPSVCWMGAHKTVIMEFPFPEVLMAVAYRIFGHHLFLSRLITLLFFTGSVGYLFLFVRRLIDTRLAVISAGVYVVLPLAIFYSRAIHIDFFSVFFAHAMAYHLLSALEVPRFRDVALAMIAGSFSFLIKAPYAFYFSLPLMCIALQQKRPLRSLTALGAVFSIPCILFFLWRFHATAVNSAMPNWEFIPGYIKFVKMGSWYFGSLEDRFVMYHWLIIWRRFVYEVTSSVGIWLFFAGLIVSLITAFRGFWRQMLPLWLWLAGVFIYVLIFFNLNIIHNYYQIPLVAVSSVFIALGIDAPRRLLRCQLCKTGNFISLLLFVTLSLCSFSYAKSNYFTRNAVRDAFGDIVRKNTPEDALIIASPNFRTDCRDPSTLFGARRYGWSIDKRVLSRDLVGRLKHEGASYLTVITDNSDEIERFKSYGYAVDVYSLPENNLSVLIADLKSSK